MSTKLYVGNISFATTEIDLQDLFAEAGEVVEVKLILDKVTGRSRGFAFVTMGSAEAAQAAIDRFNGYSLDNRSLTVNEARPREPRSFPPDRQFGDRGERRGPRRERERY
jgi:cold-inducible RNA-binding protein